MTALVRPATAADAGAIADLAARTFTLACPPTAQPADIAAFVATHLTPARFRDYLADPGRRLAVADAGESGLVGYTMLVLGAPVPEIARQLTAAPTAELSKIYVDPDHHGGTVARALLDGAVTGARTAACAGLWLGTNQANVRAQRFYLKSDFVQVGTRRFLVGSHWESDFIYERVL